MSPLSAEALRTASTYQTVLCSHREDAARHNTAAIASIFPSSDMIQIPADTNIPDNHIMSQWRDDILYTADRCWCTCCYHTKWHQQSIKRKHGPRRKPETHAEEGKSLASVSSYTRQTRLSQCDAPPTRSDVPVSLRRALPRQNLAVAPRIRYYKSSLAKLNCLWASPNRCPRVIPTGMW